jgi:hypothetical protein
LPANHHFRPVGNMWGRGPSMGSGQPRREQASQAGQASRPQTSERLDNRNRLDSHRAEHRP